MMNQHINRMILRDINEITISEQLCENPEITIQHVNSIDAIPALALDGTSILYLYICTISMTVYVGETSQSVWNRYQDSHCNSPWFAAMRAPAIFAIHHPGRPWDPDFRKLLEHVLMNVFSQSGFSLANLRTKTWQDMDILRHPKISYINRFLKNVAQYILFYSKVELVIEPKDIASPINALKKSVIQEVYLAPITSESNSNNEIHHSDDEGNGILVVAKRRDSTIGLTRTAFARLKSDGSLGLEVVENLATSVKEYQTWRSQRQLGINQKLTKQAFLNSMGGYNWIGNLESTTKHSTVLAAAFGCPMANIWEPCSEADLAQYNNLLKTYQRSNHLSLN